MDVRRTDHHFNLNDRELLRVLTWAHFYELDGKHDAEDIALFGRLKGEHRRRADRRSAPSQFPRPEMQEIGKPAEPALRVAPEHVGMPVRVSSGAWTGPRESWHCGCPDERRGAPAAGRKLRPPEMDRCLDCGQTQPNLEPAA